MSMMSGRGGSGKIWVISHFGQKFAYISPKCVFEGVTSQKFAYIRQNAWKNTVLNALRICIIPHIIIIASFDDPRPGGILISWAREVDLVLIRNLSSLLI